MLTSMGKPPPLAVRLAHRLCRSDICERFHKTALNEFYRVAFRKKVYRSIDELQADLDVWIREYNEQRPHQGRWCFGKNPDADLLGCNADDEGENDRGLTERTPNLIAQPGTSCPIEFRLVHVSYCFKVETATVSRLK